MFTEFFICSAVDFTVSRKVDMVPVASAVKARMAVSACCCCCARMAVAALAIRRRALLGRVASQDAKLAGSLRFVGRKMHFIKTGSQFALSGMCA